MAETLIIGLEEINQSLSYSKLNIQEVMKIGTIGKKHGFAGVYNKINDESKAYYPEMVMS